MTIDATTEQPQINGAQVDENGFLKTNAPVIEPGSTAQSAPAFDPPKKRRGRPPGSGKLQAEGIPTGSAKSAPKAKAAKSYSQVDFAAMGKQLVGVHEVAAMMTGIVDIRISEAEGVALAQAIGNVSEQYGLEIDGKTGAAIQLVMTAAMIYGPRALMIRAKAQQARAQSAGQVFTQDGQPTTT